MIFIAFGRWSGAYGLFKRERIYWHGRWTPFIRVGWRYPESRLDILCRWVADWLPQRIVYFCVIRAWAIATIGIFSSTSAPDITVDEILRRMDDEPGET